MAGWSKHHGGAIGAAFAGVAHNVCRCRSLLQELQDGLADFRLNVEYLAFDLEATRREDALRE